MSGIHREETRVLVTLVAAILAVGRDAPDMKETADDAEALVALVAGRFPAPEGDG